MRLEPQVAWNWDSCEYSSQNQTNAWLRLVVTIVNAGITSYYVVSTSQYKMTRVPDVP